MQPISREELCSPDSVRALRWMSFGSLVAALAVIPPLLHWPVDIVASIVLFLSVRRLRPLGRPARDSTMLAAALAILATLRAASLLACSSPVSSDSATVFGVWIMATAAEAALLPIFAHRACDLVDRIAKQGEAHVIRDQASWQKAAVPLSYVVLGSELLTMGSGPIVHVGLGMLAVSLGMLAGMLVAAAHICATLRAAPAGARPQDGQPTAGETRARD